MKSDQCKPNPLLECKHVVGFFFSLSGCCLASSPVASFGCQFSLLTTWYMVSAFDPFGAQVQSVFLAISMRKEIRGNRTGLPRQCQKGWPTWQILSTLQIIRLFTLFRHHHDQGDPCGYDGGVTLVGFLRHQKLFL